MTLRGACFGPSLAIAIPLGFLACSESGDGGDASNGIGANGGNGSIDGSTVDGGLDGESLDGATYDEFVGTIPPSRETTYACTSEIHVAVTGDDAQDGSAASPYRTVAHAALLAKPGDCVKVHAGTYAETTTIRFAVDGTTKAPIVLDAADGKGTVVIDSAANTTGPVLEIDRDDVVVDGFVMTLPVTSSFNVVVFDGKTTGKCRRSVLRNSKVTGGTNQLKIYQKTLGVLVEHNEFYGAARITPISLTGASGLIFRGNYCHDWNSGDNGAAQLAGGSANVLFEKNLFQDIASLAGTIALGDSCGDTCDNDPQHYAAVNARAINNVFVRAVRPFDILGCKNCAVLSNTLLDSGRDNLIFKIGSTTTNVTTRSTTGLRIMNNLVAARGQIAYVTQIEPGSKVGLFMDYNLYWNGAAGFTFGESHPKGSDAQSVIQAPLLTGPADLRPRPESPAVARGVDLASEVPQDFLGAQRAPGPHDIGAYQH